MKKDKLSLSKDFIQEINSIYDLDSLSRKILKIRFLEI